MAGIGLTSFIYPLGSFYILEDIYLKGGFQTVADVTARDAIAAGNRKAGMLVWTQATTTMYQLGPGLTNVDWTTWPPVMVGDSGAGGVAGLVPAPAAGDTAAGKFLKADGSWQAPAGTAGITSLTSDVTATGPGAAAATIANGVVTNAKLANVATQTFKARTSAGPGAPEDLTTAQATALLDNMVGDSGLGGTKGLVPAPAAGDAAASKFLKADGTWVAPSGSGGSYRTPFTDANLAAGILTVTHNLGVRYNAVEVYDNNNLVIFPSQITDTGVNTLTVDLGAFQTANGGSIPGTWNILVRS